VLLSKGLLLLLVQLVVVLPGECCSVLAASGVGFAGGPAA
jgi:hypothetical protein